MDFDPSALNPSFAIGDLVMAKYKRKPLLYKVMRIETVQQANAYQLRGTVRRANAPHNRQTSISFGFQGRSYPPGYPVYVLRAVLNKEGQPVANPGYRRLSAAWLIPDRHGNVYAELLENHISRLDAESEKLKNIFVKHFEKRIKI